MRRIFIAIALSVLLIHEATAQKNTSTMSRHYGHGIPPLSPLKDLDNKAFNIPAPRDHWTLLYFWADWCIPCIKEGIPELVAFVRSNPKVFPSVQIIAIRFNSKEEAGDWNLFKSTTERLENTLWHGPLPFPVVYDASTKMTSDWGIHELPTYALIDPNGNLVPNGDLKVLKEKIKTKQ